MNSKLLVWVVSLVLSSFLLLTFFTHPNADDFCKAAEVHQMGFLASMDHVYHTWSGRYVAEGLLRLFPLGLGLISDYWVGPFSVFVLLGGAIWAFARSVFTQRLGYLETTCLALLFFALYLSGAPNLYEVLYWNAASFTYQIGNISLLLLVAIALRAEGGSPKCLILAGIGCTLLAMVTTGTNEISICILLLITSLGSIFSFRSNSAVRFVWLATLIVTVMAGAFALSAPGNQARALTIPHQGKLLRSVYYGTTLGVESMLQWSSSLAVWAAAIVLIPTIHGILSEAIRQKRSTVGMVVFPVVWIGTILGIFFVGFYTTGAAPQPRVVNVAYLVFLIGWMFGCALLASRYLQTDGSGAPVLPNSIASMAKLALIIALLTSTNFKLANADLFRMGKLQEFFQVRYSLINEAKLRSESDVIVPRVRYTFNSLWEDELREDPSYWANRCWAGYFNLKSISLGSTVTPGL